MYGDQMEAGDSACSLNEAPKLVKGLTLIKAQLYYIYIYQLPDEIYLYIKLRDTRL